MIHDLTALACPFCGSVAKWTHQQESYRHEDGVERVIRWQSSIHCTGCRLPHCSGFGQVEWTGGNALAHQHAMRLALEQWNRRAAPPAPAAVPLTVSEIERMWSDAIMNGADGAILFARAIERAHGIAAAGDKP